MRWYVVHEGKTKGPFEEAALLEFAGDGRTASTDELCAEGSDDWFRAGAHRPLANLIPPASRKTGDRRTIE
jgi:hypothetical protein